MDEHVGRPHPGDAGADGRGAGGDAGRDGGAAAGDRRLGWCGWPPLAAVSWAEESRVEGGPAMAKIVLGMASSHGPQLAMTPPLWPRRAAADRANPELWYAGKTYNFPELVE